jgi:uncharacterized protein YukE
MVFEAKVAHGVAIEVAGLAVTPDNVLQIRNTLKGESDLLGLQLRLHQPNLVVGAPGRDPVSGEAAKAFNEKIKGLLDGCWAYVNVLADAAESLHQTALGYGNTEDQITASFTNYAAEHQTEWDRLAAINSLPDPIRNALQPPTSAPQHSLPGMIGSRL